MSSIRRQLFYRIANNSARYWSRGAAEKAARAQGIGLNAVKEIVPEKPWRAWVRRQGHPKKSRSFHTKVAAERWVREVEHAIDNGGWRDPAASRKALMPDIIDTYENDIAKYKRGYEASEKYRIAGLRARFAKDNLAGMDAERVVKFINARLEEASRETVIRELTILRHILETCKSIWHYPLVWDRNPVTVARKHLKLKAPRGRTRRLASAEQAALLDAAAKYEDGRMLHFILFAIEVPLRRGEFASLKWAAVLRDEWLLRVHDTKTQHEREVPLSRIALDALKAVEELKLKGDTIFGYAASTLSHAFLKICRKAGIEDLRLHDLRREGASRLIEMGLTVLETQAVTGHATVAMLQRYVRPRARELAEKMREMQAAVTSGGDPSRPREL